MEVITLIVQFAQEIEHPDLWKALSIYRFRKEDPTETLHRIRALLKKGLVSKLWRDAISDPRLWTTFLNASMADDQFLRVVARSGNLPVVVRFKAQKYNSLSDNTVRAITSKSPSITGLILDMSNATPSPIGPTFFGRGPTIQHLYDLRGAPVFEKAWVTLDIVLHRHALLGIHDDDEVPQILECFSAFFQGLEDIQNVQIAQYVVLGGDSIELDPWEDLLRLFQHHHPEDSAHRSALLFPNLKTLRIVEPPQGVSGEFHRELTNFTWEHVQSRANRDKGEGIERFEILLLSGDLVGIKYEPPSAPSHEDWDVLCARLCGLDSTHHL